jgi:plasmid maintenance system antidote protein VapI
MEPAEVFPVSEYVSDEMHARGWDESRLAAEMGTTIEDARAVLDGFWITDMAARLGRAFGTGERLWNNLMMSELFFALRSAE